MKTKFALSAVVMVITILGSGNIVWAQGRGNGHGRGHHSNGGHGGNGGGNSNGNGHGNSHHYNNNNDRYHSERYHHTDHNYYHHDNHHHSKKIVVVNRPAPVVVINRPAPVVVHHHHYGYHEPRYVYYRDYDVYYDMTRRVYISFTGRNWSISTEIPVRMYYVDRGTIVTTNVDYYDDDFAGYLDSRRPNGRHCDEW